MPGHGWFVVAIGRVFYDMAMVTDVKKTICLLLVLTLLLPALSLAKTPAPITPIPYESLPNPPAGMHHYLLACIDSWDGTADLMGNTDGVVLATLDTAHQRVLITTFMREMLVERPTGGAGRITYIAKKHGPEALLRTISTHFGVKVEKYIFFNMDHVQKIIDAMGGVPITVTDAEADYLNRYRISRDSTTPSMNKRGTYLFSGHAAVIYMRIRKVGGEGDLGRNRRMRTVLSTLAMQMQKVDLKEALALLNMVLANQVQTNLSMTDMIQATNTAMQLRGVSPELLQMPPSEAISPITYAGMQTQEVDFAMAQQTLNDFLYADSYE